MALQCKGITVHLVPVLLRQTPMRSLSPLNQALTMLGALLQQAERPPGEHLQSLIFLLKKFIGKLLQLYSRQFSASKSGSTILPPDAGIGAEELGPMPRRGSWI